MLDLRLVLAFLWITGCMLVTAWLWRKQGAIQLPAVHWAVLTAFAVRIVPAALLPMGARYEMHVFEQAGAMVLHGESVYRSNTAHPYLPFQIYIFAVAAWLTDVVGMPFPFWAKLPSILADTFIALMVYFGVMRLRSTAEALYAGWYYALSPVVILVSGYQGQFDAIPLLMLVGAWYIFEFTHKAKVVTSSFMLGIGVLAKTFPVFLLPILFLRITRPVQRLLSIVAIAIAPVTAILVFEFFFPNSILPIVNRTLRAGPIPGWWGYSSLINAWVQLTEVGEPLYKAIVLAGRYLALATATLVILLTRRSPVLDSMLLTILTLFALIPNLGLQSLTWLIPIGLLVGASELRAYTVGVFIHMIVAYWGIHLTDGLYLLIPALYAAIIIQLSSLAAWGPVVWWWWKELRRQRVFSLHLSPQTSPVP